MYGLESVCNEYLWNAWMNKKLIKAPLIFWSRDFENVAFDNYNADCCWKH
jgi:hypothetical protein